MTRQQPLPSASPPDDAYSLRRRPLADRLLDRGFHSLTMLLAGLVATLLLGILITVFHGAREAMANFGLRFLTSSGWDPVNNAYGA